jgi:hypothetical protein
MRNTIAPEKDQDQTPVTDLEEKDAEAPDVDYDLESESDSSDESGDEGDDDEEIDDSPDLSGI